MKKRNISVSLLACVLAIAPTSLLTEQATAAPRPDAGEEAGASEEILVIARRSGAPMWTIETEAGVVILVGEIAEVPKATPWRPERLEGATMRAQRIILGTRAKISPGDIFRLIFRGGRLTRLPKGQTAANYLDPRQFARLQVLEKRFDQDYSRQNFLMAAFDLLSKRLAFNRDTADDASDVVRRAARDAKIPTRPVGEVRGEDMLDNLFEAPPETHIPCLDAAMTAAEAGPRIVADRGAAWTEYDVARVMANPLEEALGRCWPWSSDRIGTELRRQWIDAIHEAATQPGVTLAVVPLRILAEGDGVLDRLETRGFAISGPAWRKENAENRATAEERIP